MKPSASIFVVDLVVALVGVVADLGLVQVVIDVLALIACATSIFV